MDRRELPIFGLESDLVSNVRKTGRLIVSAPTGSGKSTQIPQMLLDHGLLGTGQVVILQPRRLPARLLAARVADERRVRLGGEVGYQIRFDDVSSRDTRIKYVTEGILLRQFLTNPRLDGVSAIVFDEFHERHLYGDVTLARALDLQAASRPDLKIIVMSATLDAGPLQTYLAPCASLTSEGRVHPVAIQYLEGGASAPPWRRGSGALQEDAPAWDLAVDAFERLVAEGAEGDFLVFMPGTYEIARTCDAIRNSPAARGFIVLPLHGELPVKDQDAAVSRHAQRKVVVATNVAESSITIDGIRVVIDGGLARIPRFDPYRGINTLLIEKISRASADQRAGRAGRTAPGVCVRLWTAREHAERPLHEVPEVRRLDLAEVVLTLKAAGVPDIRAFRWLEPPDPRSLDRAELLLRDLGALDSHTGAITPLGSRMLAFPVHPRYARMLIAADAYDCVRSVALIAALTQGRNLLLRKKGREVKDDRDDFLGEESESDFFILMRAWGYARKNGYDVGKCSRLGIHAQSARQVEPLFGYFLDIARREGLKVGEGPGEDEAIQKSVLTGFVDQLACRADAGTLRCRLVHGRKGEIARESAVRNSPLVVAAEIHEIEGRGGDLNVLLTLVTAVRREWLSELYPDEFSETVDVTYDPAAKKVVARGQVLFRDLVLESKALLSPPKAEAAEWLAAEVIKGNLTLKKWDHTVEQWIARLNCLAAWCPDLQLPPIGAEDRKTLIEQVCFGATSYKEIKEKPVWPVLKSWLGPGQEAVVDKYAPERIDLPNGKRAKVTYAPDTNPHIAVRIQDLYGVTQTPKIAVGRVPVVIEILGPNHRPVQITQDLAGFWKEHYPRVKQELQRKYPKHEWR